MQGGTVSVGESGIAAFEVFRGWRRAVLRKGYSSFGGIVPNGVIVEYCRRGVS